MSEQQAAQRNMRLALALLETVPNEGLTIAEYDALNSLVLNARLLTSSLLARSVQANGHTQDQEQA